MTFSGYGGQPIKGWLLLPRVRSGSLPCVVEYIGYGGGRGLPLDWLLWSNAGYAHLVMDTRGQGSTWRAGDTPDLEADGGNPQIPGFMTRGILNPQTYYYRRVFTDAVRAVEAAAHAPGRGRARASPSPAAARAAASPWPRPGWSRTWPPSCPMCRSCATTAARSSWSTPIPITRSPTTATPTATKSRRPLRRWPTSTA